MAAVETRETDERHGRVVQVVPLLRLQHLGDRSFDYSVPPELNERVTVVPVSVVKGLELDGVVVVEPAAIVAGEQQGLRALYVALTRSTKRLTIVHAEPLPAAMG